MNIGVILPHSQLYGGVKRFFELGNFFVRDGHSFVVFNEKGDHPDWFQFNGEIKKIEELNNYEFDVLFFNQTKYYQTAAEANAKVRIYYFAKSGVNLKNIVKDYWFPFKLVLKQHRWPLKLN